MARGDWIIFYSPRTTHPDGSPLQAFTAIGQVVDDEPYEADVSGDRHPWRRNVDFLDCVETPIRPLIDDLDFVENKQRWGYKFRFGVFRIDDHDFEIIRTAMTRPPELVAAATVNEASSGVSESEPNDPD